MVLAFYLFCSVNLWLILANFSKKLIVLLGFESLFLVMVIFLFLFCRGMSNNFFFLLFFSIFIVLDRVLGVRFLVAAARNSSVLRRSSRLF